MNKQLLVIIFWLFALLPGFAQDFSKLIRSDTVISSLNINQSNKKNILNNQAFNLAANNNPLIQHAELSIINEADLSFKYTMIELEEGFRYAPIKLHIRANNSLQNFPKYSLSKNNTFYTNDHLGRYLIDDAMENSLLYGENYDLMVITQLYGTTSEISCMEGPPKFSMKFTDRWPYYTALAVGTPLILNGIFNKQSKLHYDRYVEAWEMEGRGDLAQEHIKEAKRSDSLRSNLLNTGIVLVTGSLTGLLYRYFFKHKPKVTKFKKYCKSSSASL